MRLVGAYVESSGRDAFALLFKTPNLFNKNESLQLTFEKMHSTDVHPLYAKVLLIKQ